MKHIKKRYLFQEKDLEGENSPDSTIIQLSDPDLIKKAKNYDMYVVTTKGYRLKAFAYNYNGKNAVIPIPDLSLVYFDTAYNLFKLRKNQESLMFEKIVISNNRYNEDATNEIYRFYGFASSCLILLFTSLESFVNYMIPNDKPYIVELKNKTEVYNKQQIQKNIQFDDKVKKVLPYYFKKDFFSRKTPQNQYIENLKELRDQIIHTKSEESFTSQENLIKRLIKFKYEETFKAVATFMNFFKEGYNVECDCNMDY
jgi:hypothetical protein